MSKRSRKGGGTVFWDEDRGCYTGQLSHYDEAGNRKRPKVHAATKAECWEKLDELRAELKKTGSVAPRDLTVADVITDLLAHPPADWKSPLTMINRRNYAERIIAALGKVKVARLTVAQVERFLADAAAEGLSADMLRRLRSTLRLAIRRAERDGRATRNVAALAEIPAAPAPPVQIDDPGADPRAPRAEAHHLVAGIPHVRADVRPAAGRAARPSLGRRRLRGRGAPGPEMPEGAPRPGDRQAGARPGRSEDTSGPSARSGCPGRS